MKVHLVPHHSQKIGNNYVLWFESSNSYVVLSSTAFLLLNAYIESKNQNAFIERLQKDFDISEAKAQDYFIEFTSFLSDLTIETSGDQPLIIPNSIPKTNILKQYVFGDAKVGINFSDPHILKLLHPYLQHASVENLTTIDFVFDIFEQDDHLHLYKNTKHIGSFKASNFHLLQGKFSMELVTSIYGNTESDWLATFHASTVCNEKEAIMIIGDSGNGKSTLSAVLMANGFDLLADDFTPMLAENQHLYRFPAAISIKKGAFSMIESLYDGFDMADHHQSHSKPVTVKYLPPSKPFKTSQKHFECQKLVRVKYAKNATSELKVCDSETLLQTFIPDSWISPQPEHSKQFLLWLKSLTFYELTYSDNDFAVSKFKELFEI
ncbi:MAG: hypothetical protein ACSHXF_05975 [Aquaticitalea sp.]